MRSRFPTWSAAAVIAALWLPVAGNTPGSVRITGPGVSPVDGGLSSVIARADSLDPITSLLVWHRDTLLIEQYFDGMRPERAVNFKSASKSIVGLLVGIALEEGAIDSLDQPVRELLPDHARVLADPVKRTITVRHLLSMQSGLESTSSRNYGSWVASPNWVRDALERPVECEPGTCWGYSTGTTHILGVILAERTGRSLPDYAAERLFGPLGVPVRSWDRDPQGYYLGGNNMAFRPAEMLRLGRLLLDRGRLDDRSIVPTDWLEEAWGTYARSPYNGNGYGYHWWNRMMSGERVVFAWGYGGQFLYLVPRLDLAIVVTSSLDTRRPRGHNERVHNLVADGVIPAARRRHPTLGPMAR